LQIDAYGKESNIPKTLFDVLKEQRDGLMALKHIYGSVVTPAQLEASDA
jgi:phosphoenolpyruvate carboxykinase (GTP)